MYTAESLGSARAAASDRILWTAADFLYDGGVFNTSRAAARLTLGEPTMRVFKRWGFAALALILAAGWSVREVAFALEQNSQVKAGTITLDQVEMKSATDKGESLGKHGVYLSGDTPASTKFATGRFVLQPGKTPHAPHTHPEEEVMIIESGHGEILCDGKTTKVGPGSLMYTTPNAEHGITNTGDEPIVFYYIKWEGRK
jgi:mannose-6-phosphate isomerase-like protein (cupin superfamily)